MDENTDHELRMRVAKAKGWKWREWTDGNEVNKALRQDENFNYGAWYVGDKMVASPVLPNWPIDRSAWLELMEEIQAGGAAVCMGYDTESKKWYAAWNVFGSDAANDWMMFEADTLQVAACNAYLAWKEAKA
jgi:hypothetical protein